MGFFKKLFRSKKLNLIDPDFGPIESGYIKGDKVLWKVIRQFWGTDIDVFFTGNKNGIFEKDKQIFQSAIDSEPLIKSESIFALKELFENAEMEFITIDKHFELFGISVCDGELELTFQEKENLYHFCVHFENNKQVGTSINS